MRTRRSNSPGKNRSRNERKLKSTLLEAETKQLQKYLRTRSNQLDLEIASTKSKLYENFDKSQFKNQNDLVSNIAVRDHNMKVFGTKLSTNSPNKDISRSSYLKNNIKSKPLQEENGIVSFFQYLRNGLHEAGILAADLDQLVLTATNNDTGMIHISEITDILQHDLLLPISEFYEEAIISNYCDDASGYIDGIGLLTDAGLWDEEGLLDSKRRNNINSNSHETDRSPNSPKSPSNSPFKLFSQQQQYSRRGNNNKSGGGRGSGHHANSIDTDSMVLTLSPSPSRPPKGREGNDWTGFQDRDSDRGEHREALESRSLPSRRQQQQPSNRYPASDSLDADFELWKSDEATAAALGSLDALLETTNATRNALSVLHEEAMKVHSDLPPPMTGVEDKSSGLTAAAGNPSTHGTTAAAESTAESAATGSRSEEAAVPPVPGNSAVATIPSTSGGMASAANHQFHHSANHREGLYPYRPSYLQQTFDNRNQMDGNNNNHNNNNNSSDNFGSKSMLTSEWEAYTTSKKPESVLSRKSHQATNNNDDFFIGRKPAANQRSRQPGRSGQLDSSFSSQSWHPTDDIDSMLLSPHRRVARSSIDNTSTERGWIGNDKNDILVEDISRHRSTLGGSGLLQSKYSTKEKFKTKKEFDDFLEQERLAERERQRERVVGTRLQMVKNSPHGLMAASIHNVVRTGSDYSIGTLAAAVAGIHEDGVFDLCERRLAFELSCHASPGRAAAALVHRVVDIAGRNGSGFITCQQLNDALRSVDLMMTAEEVEMLASGFASDAKGGINAIELCRAIQTMLHTSSLQPAAVAPSQPTSNTFQLSEKDLQGELKDVVEDILLNICETILGQDRLFAVTLPEEEALVKEVVTPFAEIDTNEDRILPPMDFAEALSSFGYDVSKQELLVLMQAYPGSLVKPKDLSDLNAMSWRDMTALTSMSDSQRENQNTMIGVSYLPFVRHLCNMLMHFLLRQRGEGEGGVGGVGIQSWALRELELLELLLSQLENMPAATRRRNLMVLQHTLIASDVAREGDLDGFTVLKALLAAGFNIPRLHRVRLLRSIEEMGGKIDYTELCQLLLRTCLEWMTEEKTVVGKILKAMGVTVAGRRDWLTNLRSDFLRAEAAAASQSNGAATGHPPRGTTHRRVQQPSNRFRDSSGGSRNRSSMRSSYGSRDFDFGGSVGRSDGNLEDLEEENDEELLGWTGKPAVQGVTGGISPSAFLQCLRGAGVTLAVEEEASLLDCVDMEWRAAGGQLMAKDDFTVPLIHYKSFLSFLSRHVGSWDSAHPDLAWRLRSAVLRPVLSPEGEMSGVGATLAALNELGASMSSFDENGDGLINKRAFQICCHRSPILDCLHDDDIDALSEALVIPYTLPVTNKNHSSSYRKNKKSMNGEGEDEGAIRYYSFLSYLRILLVNVMPSQFEEDVKGVCDEIWQQLLSNGSDERDQGSLKPIRVWLRTNISEKDGLMTVSDVANLLTDFHVPFGNDILKLIILEIGPIGFTFTFDDRLSMNKLVIECKTILKNLRRIRSHWTVRLPRLAVKIRKCLQSAAEELELQNAGEVAQKVGQRMALFADWNYNSTESMIGGGSRRLRNSDEFETGNDPLLYTGSNKRRAAGTSTFRDIFKEDSQFMNSSINNSATASSNPMIRIDAFVRICRVFGVALDDRDVWLLADATDDNPSANHVSCNVILESIMMPSRIHARRTRPSAPQSFALKHLQSMLWNTARRLQRSVSQWEADVRNVFAGLSRGGGMIALEDFSLALQLLSATIAPDILHALPLLPSSGGDVVNASTSSSASRAVDGHNGHTLVYYEDVLNKVLEPPRGYGVESQPEMGGEEGGGSRREEEAGTGTTRGGNRTALNRLTGRKFEENIRSSLGLFLEGDDDYENAKEEMLKVFRKFATKSGIEKIGKGKIPPRDFCLSVSVLMGGDDAVLTKQEWKDIVDAFKDNDGLVDYLKFAALVLDRSTLSFSASKPAPGSPTQRSKKSAGLSSKSMSAWKYSYSGSNGSSSPPKKSTSTAMSSSPDRRRLTTAPTTTLSVTWNQDIDSSHNDSNRFKKGNTNTPSNLTNNNNSSNLGFSKSMSAIKSYSMKDSNNSNSSNNNSNRRSNSKSYSTTII